MPLTGPQQAWVDALRSGEYKQTKGALARREDESGEVSYCCLGVACELAVRNSLPVERQEPNGSIVIRFSENTTRLPDIVMRWLGLKTSSGNFATDGEGYVMIPGNHVMITNLAGLNDEGNFTFEQIADFIETNADRLFV